MNELINFLLRKILLIVHVLNYKLSNYRRYYFKINLFLRNNFLLIFSFSPIICHYNIRIWINDMIINHNFIPEHIVSLYHFIYLIIKKKWWNYSITHHKLSFSLRQRNENEIIFSRYFFHKNTEYATSITLCCVIVIKQTKQLCQFDTHCLSTT